MLPTTIIPNRRQLSLQRTGLSVYREVAAAATSSRRTNELNMSSSFKFPETSRGLSSRVSFGEVRGMDDHSKPAQRSQLPLFRYNEPDTRRSSITGVDNCRNGSQQTRNEIFYIISAFAVVRCSPLWSGVISLCPSATTHAVVPYVRSQNRVRVYTGIQGRYILYAY